MNEDLKTQAWSQGIAEQSTTQKETLGALRILADGRKFRYGRAGASAALAIGQMCGTAPAIANHIKQANTGYTMAVGDTSVTVLLGATAATEDQYKDGYLQIYDGAATAVGQNLRISSNPAAALSTAMTIQLADPVRYACIATDSYALIPNPWSVCIVIAAAATPPAGVPATKIAASSYGWFQTGGVANLLNLNNTALGSEITNTTTGAFITASIFTSYAYGYTISFAGVTTKYNPVFLVID
jgi:hypothetical protein